MSSRETKTLRIRIRDSEIDDGEIHMELEPRSLHTIIYND